MEHTPSSLGPMQWEGIVLLTVLLHSGSCAFPQDGPKAGPQNRQKEESTVATNAPLGRTTNVTVEREGNRVWIEGAKELFHQHFEDSRNGRATPWAERSDTYMYLTQMRIAGWRVNYADLITIAGYGPSFAYAPRLEDKWGAHYFPPKGRDERIAHATGCQYRWHQYKDVEDYWQALKRAIDAGHAVHGPNEEDVLFIGYIDAEKPEDRKVMPLAIVFVDDDEWTWEQFMKWHARDMVNGWFGRIEERVEPWPANKSAVEVMQMMATFAEGNDPRRKPNDGVTWGIEGIEAYAVDLADMAKSGAREGEGGYFQGGWRGCHNVYPQMSGRPAAATYLERIARLFERDAQRHILAAAAGYERATEAWAAFTGQLGRDTQRVAKVEHSTAWTMAQYRKAGAAAVADAAKHERAAIGALRQALAALKVPLAAGKEAAEVKHEGNRVVIGDVPRPFGSCSSLAVLTALLQQRGEDVSYTYLMGASSRAFRFQFSWCPSAPHAYIGFNTFEPALKAMGYGRTQLAGQYTWTDEGHRDATDAEREQTRAAVKAAIDAGQPVMFGSEEDSLLVGYEPTSDGNPTGWLSRPGPLGGPVKPDEPYVQPIKKMPWGLCTLEKTGDRMPRREAALWAIRTAIINAERGTVEGKNLKTGFAAWQKWIDELPAFGQVVERTSAELRKAGRKDAPLFELQLGNAWCYENLHFARLEASKYLRAIASDLPGAARPPLSKAADEYESAARALVPEGECFTEIAPYPWKVNGRVTEWTDALRERQAALLREGLEHERAAIDALKAAVAEMPEVEE